MHDGRLMRYHKATGSALEVLMHSDVPKRSDGAVDMCQRCQRRVWYAGGYLEMLVYDLLYAAKYPDNQRPLGWKG